MSNTTPLLVELVKMSNDMDKKQIQFSQEQQHLIDAPPSYVPQQEVPHVVTVVGFHPTYSPTPQMTVLPASRNSKQIQLGLDGSFRLIFSTIDFRSRLLPLRHPIEWREY